MSDQTETEQIQTASADVRDIVRQAIEEFIHAEQRKAEPAYRTELQDERKRREALEARLNQLVEENRQTKAVAEEADRNAQIRSELQQLGVAKIDLAFKAIKDDIVRASDGQLQARGKEGKSLREFLTTFVQENPELLPARIAGGSGAQIPMRDAAEIGSPVDINKIKPGMSKDELERVRKEISRIASQALRGV
ncbi:MAG: hypothetical protein JO033_12895 [Acidobacteriaceae bacterium]|nr:hypothetical protein [Acidobacteriaceae bacterium]MBV9500312.1 hypothetical protein [Acidobacteriaceae bacterium]